MKTRRDEQAIQRLPIPLFRNMHFMDKQDSPTSEAILRSLPDLLRHFPYLTASAQFFPIYAYLYGIDAIDSPAALLMMIPFIFTHAAGFAYNNLVDRIDPPFRKNPVVAGAISPRQARWVILLCVGIGLTTFGLLYRSPIAWASYLLYLFLALAYSGLGMRFKESLAGPFIAAYGWTAGPLILALEFGILWEASVLSLVAAIYLIYVGREIYHTIIDYDNDLQAGYRTFALRTSSSTQRTALVATVASGAFCFLLSIYTFLAGRPLLGVSGGLGALLVLLILLAVVLETLFCIRHEGFHPATAFFLLRTGFILYAALILNMPTLMAALLLWAFLMGRRS